MVNIKQLLPQYIVNSKLYYHIYYKHTAKHKRDMENTYNRSMEVRNRIIGKWWLIMLSKNTRMNLKAWMEMIHIRPIKKKDKQICEFFSDGFAKSNKNLLSKLRRRQINWRVFNCGLSSKRGKGKYSSVDLIGGMNKYYYIVGMEENLIEYLVDLFNLKNPCAPPHMKGAFNHMLRNNYLIDNKRCVFK